MKLSEETKSLIIKENNDFRARQYGGLTKAERKKLGAVYSPGEVIISMLESCKSDSLDGAILDPCCGSGNILAACLIAGAHPYNIFGNEIEPSMVELCKKRINAVCDMLGKPHVREWQIHCGNALDPTALTCFDPEYDLMQQKELEIYGERHTGFKAGEEFKKMHKGKKLKEAMEKYGFTN